MHTFSLWRTTAATWKVIKCFLNHELNPLLKGVIWKGIFKITHLNSQFKNGIRNTPFNWSFKRLIPYWDFKLPFENGFENGFEIAIPNHDFKSQFQILFQIAISSPNFKSHSEMPFIFAWLFWPWPKKKRCKTMQILFALFLPACGSSGSQW